MLYFLQEIEPPHRIKIGFSLNPAKRIAVWSASLPQRLQVLKIIPGDREDESWLHVHWKEFRVEGTREWYYPFPELLDYIDVENVKFSA